MVKYHNYNSENEIANFFNKNIIEYIKKVIFKELVIIVLQI